MSNILLKENMMQAIRIGRITPNYHYPNIAAICKIHFIKTSKSTPLSKETRYAYTDTIT
jgi:hypothetical protein